MNPRAGADTLAWHDKAEPAQRAEIDRRHVTVAVIAAVGFGVAIVETAATVHVPAGGHHVNALRGASRGDAVRGVVAVPGAGGDEDPVDLLPTGGDR